LVTLIQDAVFPYPKRFADGTKETLPIGKEVIEGFFWMKMIPLTETTTVYECKTST
jgi:hypothetical protein